MNPASSLAATAPASATVQAGAHTDPVDTRLEALRALGAAQIDPVGWHYLEVLAARTRAQPDRTRALLQDKLGLALQAFKSKMDTAQLLPAASAATAAAQPSPLGVLLQEMASPTMASTDSAAPGAAGWRGDRPKVQQFRKQLRKISLQKQVSQAIAQAPQNAGPINSHMLVLRALGLMRDISPDYLNRFMTYVDTLLRLDEAEHSRPTPPRKTPAARSRK